MISLEEKLPVEDEALFDLIIEIYPTGSRATLMPPPEFSDYDYVINVVDMHEFCQLATETHGFTTDSHCNPEKYLGAESNFISIRKNDLNLIVTHKNEFYNKFVAATTVARLLNVKTRSDRVALFKAVLYGMKCEPTP
jgi:hypothetical protein